MHLNLFTFVTASDDSAQVSAFGYFYATVSVCLLPDFKQTVYMLFFLQDLNDLNVHIIGKEKYQHLHSSLWVMLKCFWDYHIYNMLHFL